MLVTSQFSGQRAGSALVTSRMKYVVEPAEEDDADP
jgi:hypothetical protein